MRRREAEVPGFLERPASWWAERRPHLNPTGIMDLPAFAGMLLAGLGELRGDELARLREIAAGVDQHRAIRPDTAQAILRRYWTVEAEVDG